MENISRLISLLVLVWVLIGGTTACNFNSTSTLDEGAIRVYADPATETTLQGLSENNLAKYTQFGNTEFKALTQDKFNEAATQVNNQLGAYQSKDFLRIEEQQGYIIVHYKAKYTKGEARVRMVFDKDHLVAGQWFE